MKFDFLKSVSPLEIILFIVFVVYILFPINTPHFLIPIVNSSFGLAILFISTVYLLFYTTPILAVLAVLVAYEIVRRSNKPATKTYTHSPEYRPPSQENKDDKLVEMNPIKVESLEEEVIHTMAPIGKSDPSTYIETSYKPIADPLFCSGSMCN